MQEIEARESLAREMRLLVPESREVPGEWQIAHTAASDRDTTHTVPQVLRSRSRTRRRRRKRSWAAPWAYSLPTCIVYGTFWIGPTLFSVSLSFFDRDIASPQKVIVSLENYQRVLTDPLFYISLRTTLGELITMMIPPRRCWCHHTSSASSAAVDGFTS
jgi:hypothetical protein